MINHTDTKINVEIMKQFNLLSVLNIIRTQGPISRAEIADKIELSRPSVSEIVRELVISEWIRELPASRTHRGRRPVPLDINPTGRYILGVSVVAFHLTVLLTGLNGEPMAEISRPIERDGSPEEALELACQMCEDLIRDYDIPRGKILGVGVAMHGMVDPQNGRAIYAPHLGWRDIAVGSFIEQRLALQTFVEADSNSTALAELWFGAGGGSRHFVAMVVDYGIGAGIVYDGKLYRGANHIDGQIGHTTVDEHGPLCTCGNFGCLEVMASEPSIVHQVEQRIRSRESSEVIVSDGVGTMDSNIEAVYRSARAGDRTAVEVLRIAGKYVGLSMTTIINVINPQFIVLSGGFTGAADIVLPVIREVIRARSFNDVGKETPVLISPLGKRVYSIGAVALVLDHVFGAPETLIPLLNIEKLLS